MAGEAPVCAVEDRPWLSEANIGMHRRGRDGAAKVALLTQAADILWVVTGLVTTAEHIGSLLREVQGKMGSNQEEPGQNPGHRSSPVHLCLWGCGLGEGRSQVKSCMGAPGTPPGGWSVQTGSITALVSWIQAENDGDGWVLSLRSWGEFLWFKLWLEHLGIKIYDEFLLVLKKKIITNTACMEMLANPNQWIPSCC